MGEARREHFGQMFQPTDGKPVKIVAQAYRGDSPQ